MLETVSFKLNGRPMDLRLDTDRSLLWVLRTELSLTGTKCGCDEGWCGACTVLVDNRAERSCEIPVKGIVNRHVVTIEGLGTEAALHPIQKAFAEKDALQCGFCTPGMILKAYGLIAENPNVTESEIIEGMEGNLCRCGAHVRIIDAIKAAAVAMKGGTR